MAKFTCELCGVGGLDEAGMRVHMQSHTLDDAVKSGAIDESLELFDDNEDDQACFSINDHKTSCPFCGLESPDLQWMTNHVNSEHLDILSPSKGVCNSDQSSNNKHGNMSSSLSCPFCDITLKSVLELENHVQLDHADSLSPKSNQSTLESAAGKESVCPMCGDYFDPDLLDAHVQNHFVSEFDLAQSSQHQPKVPKRKLELDQFQPARFLTSSADVDSGLTSTADITATLSLSGSEVVFICCHCDHFAASSADRGWGCGYRNTQMLISSLAREPELQDMFVTRSNDVSNGTGVPSILRLQTLIEKAWQNGFDTAGCLQLHGRLVETKKWIGATEIVTLLSFLAIKTTLVDFHKPSGPDKTHPLLFAWVKAYFKKDRPADKAYPLYFQHQGHSRTIIGIETYGGNGANLLILDPSCPVTKMKAAVAASNVSTTSSGAPAQSAAASKGPKGFKGSASDLISILRVPMYSLRHIQYQIVAMGKCRKDGSIVSESLTMTAKEWNESKALTSIRVP